MQSDPQRPAELSGKGELAGDQEVVRALGGIRTLMPLCRLRDPGFLRSRGLRFSSYAVLCCLTPMSGSMLPQPWPVIEGISTTDRDDWGELHAAGVYRFNLPGAWA